MKDTLVRATSLSGDVLSRLLGSVTPGEFIAGFIFALIGIFISLLIGTTNRNPLSERTPPRFSFVFLLSDNAIRIYKSIALTVLILFVSIRFSKEFIGKEFTMFYALCLGLGLDTVIARWKLIKEAFGKLSVTKKADVGE
jgi:hypothetical protein